MALGYVVCDYTSCNRRQRNGNTTYSATEFKHHSILKLHKPETCKMTSKIPCFDLPGLPKFRGEVAKLREQVPIVG